MRFNPGKAKAISEETRELGKQFVQAMLREEHDYDSIQSNFLALLAIGALGAASQKLATNPRALCGPSGHVRGSFNEAARMLGITRNYVSKMAYGASLMQPAQRRSLKDLAAR